MMLPVIEPAPLTAVKVPIDHPNWLYELKHDGFRGMLYLDRDRAWLWVGSQLLTWIVGLRHQHVDSLD
jgi:hypothetical protein